MQHNMYSMSCIHNIRVLPAVGICMLGVAMLLLLCDVRLKPKYGGTPPTHGDVYSKRFARSDDKLLEGKVVEGEGRI